LCYIWNHGTVNLANDIEVIVFLEEFLVFREEEEGGGVRCSMFARVSVEMQQKQYEGHLKRLDLLFKKMTEKSKDK